jgi:hypothetical protein
MSASGGAAFMAAIRSTASAATRTAQYNTVMQTKTPVNPAIMTIPTSATFPSPFRVHVSHRKTLFCFWAFYARRRAALSSALSMANPQRLKIEKTVNEILWNFDG